MRLFVIGALTALGAFLLYKFVTGCGTTVGGLFPWRACTQGARSIPPGYAVNAVTGALVPRQQPPPLAMPDPVDFTPDETHAPLRTREIALTPEQQALEVTVDALPVLRDVNEYAFGLWGWS